MRVLLVEDDIATAAGLEMMLRKEEFVCERAECGEDAAEIGKRNDHDLIILDLMLPDIDGYEVMGRLRRAEIPTPVLVLSGLGGIDSRIKALDLGAKEFICKPVERRELLARMRAVLHHRQGDRQPEDMPARKG